MHLRPVDSAFAAALLLGSVTAQSYQLHGPTLLPARVEALAFDPASGRLAAAMRKSVTVSVPAGSQELHLRIGTRWQRVDEGLSWIRFLVADRQRGRLVGIGNSPTQANAVHAVEWDGTSWTPPAPLQLTQSPNDILACYHEGLGKVVFVEPMTRTMTWDGSQWQQLGTAVPPLGTADGALVYDRARSVVVLCTQGQIWEFDTVSWQQRNVPAPPVGNDFAFAYDEARQRCVLFGGPAWPQGTWEYDGTRWRACTPTQVPPWRARASMTFDPARQRLVMLGGIAVNPVTQVGLWHNDEWEWDGRDWLPVQQDRRPPDDGDVAMVEEPVHGGVLLTTTAWTSGGTRMWRWTGADWQGLRPGAAHPTTVNAMCSDPSRGAIWCFDSGLGARTWRFDGVTWKQLAPTTSPVARSGSAMAFDRVRNVAVLFGGDNYFTTFDDTWEWDGLTWTLRNPAHRPPARQLHSMAFDPVSGRILMNGGTSGPQSTWAWDGTDWTDTGQFNYAIYGSAARMVEFRALNRVLLWNGAGLTAEWDGTAWIPWTTLMPAALRSGRFLKGASFDDTLVVFDGAHTWVLSPFAASTTSYGAGCGAATSPRLAAGGSPTPGARDFGLLVDRAEANGLSLLLASTAPDNVPVLGCTLLLFQPIQISVAAINAGGAAAHDLWLPAGNALRGLAIDWQAVTVGSNGLAFTQGVETVLGY